MSRFIVLVIAIPLLLILLAAVLLPLLLDKEKILELASAALHEQTGATLAVGGDIDLKVFPAIAVSLGDVSLTMPQEQQSNLQIRSLAIGVQLMPLLGGKVKINRLVVDGLNARIQQQATTAAVDTAKLSDKQLDAFYAQRRQALGEAGANASSQAALAVPLALEVQVLTVTDSRLEWLSAEGGKSTVVQLIELKASDLNAEARPIPVALEIRLPGEQPLELSLDGKVTFDPQQQLGLEQVALQLTGVTARPMALRTSGKVDINRQIADLQLALEVADTRGEGSVRYAGFESPQIDATMHFNLLDPAVLALAGPAAATTETESGGDEPLPLAALRTIDTRAELAIDKAVIGAHTINRLQLKLRAVDGVVKISSLTGELHAGKLDLQATIDGKHNTAALTTTGTLTGMDIAAALAAAAAKPVLTGSANLDWNLTSRGRTSNELVAALNGPIKLTTAEVELKDIGVERLLCQAVALSNKEQLTANFPASTRLQTLSASIQLADGEAQMRPLRAELPQITLTGTGALDLASKEFNTTFKARLSPELETLDRACRVSSRLTAIDWPVDCAGNVNTDPGSWCSVDTGKIIADLTKNEAQRKIQKKAGKLLEGLFNKD